MQPNSLLRSSRLLMIILTSVFLIAGCGQGSGKQSIPGTPAPPVPPPPPVNCDDAIGFEDACGAVSFTDFGGGVASVIDNPDMSGINTTAKVAQMQKFAGEVFGGSTLALDAPVNFSLGEVFKVKVWASRAVPLTFKFEGLGVEREVSHTGSGGWEELCFDFSGGTAGPDSSAISFLFDLGVVGDAAGAPDDWTFFFDDIQQVADCSGGGGLTLIFEDNFDTGSAPDPANWNYDTGYGPNGDGWGNNEWQLYTSNPENVRVENGNLVIEALCPSGTCGVRDDTVTSARITTKDNFEFTYGRIEARIQVPTGPGVWPAFWALGANLDTVGWPNAGEIDVMEVFNTNSDGNTVHGSMYWCDDSIQAPAACDDNGGRASATDTFRNSELLSNDFHVYAAEWDEDTVTVSFDGQVYFTQAIDPATMDEFRKDFFLLLNVAMGGGAGSGEQPPSGAEVFPQTMLVDYVRVYQAEGGSGGGDDTLIDFEDDPLSYDFGPAGGFGGGASAVIDNPEANGINTSAQTGRMLKFAGEDFAGSTLALSAPLEITEAGNVTMKVWSPRAVNVLLKFEGPVEVEDEVAHGGSGWEELTFDFSTFTGTVNGLTFIFDLGIVGDAMGDPDNWTFYFDDILIPTATSGGGGVDPGTIPDVVLYATDPGVTVDLVFGVDYTSLDPFTSGSMFDNNNTSDADFSPAFGVTTGFGYGANIGQLAFLGFAAGFADAYATIDFKAKGLNNDIIRVKFLDSGDYVDVTLTAGGVSTDLGNGWYQVSIPLTSFTGVDTATGLLFETDSTAPAEFTFLLTDIGFSGTAGGGGADPGTIPDVVLYATDPGVTVDLVFGVDYTSLDPFTSGSMFDNNNTSDADFSPAFGVTTGFGYGANIGQLAFLGFAAGFADAYATIDFKAKGLNADVIRVKFLDAGNYVDVTLTAGGVSTDLGNGWYQVSIPLTSFTGVDTATGLLFETDNTAPAEFTFLLTDIGFSGTAGGGGGGAPPSTDFEGPGPYNFSNFGGGVATIIDNPQANGINTSATVGQMQKFAGDVFGGSTLDIGGNVDWSNGEIYSVKVWSQRAVPVLFKLEGLNQERTANHTGSGWEVLCFDFTGTTGGAPATAITLIFDNGVVGDAENDPTNWTFYFDDIEQTSSCGGGGGGADPGTIPDVVLYATDPGVTVDLVFGVDYTSLDPFTSGSMFDNNNTSDADFSPAFGVTTGFGYGANIGQLAFLGFAAGFADAYATIDFKAKGLNNDIIRVKFLDSGNYVDVTLTAGGVSTDLGNGWYQVSIPLTSFTGVDTATGLLFETDNTAPAEFTFLLTDIGFSGTAGGGGPADPGTIPDVVLYATDPGVTVDLVFGVDYTSLDPFTSGSMFDNNNTSDADFSPAFGVTTGFGYGANIGQLAFLGFAAGFADAYATIDFKAKGLNADVIRVKFLDAGNYVDVTLTAGGVSTDLGNGWYQVSIPLTSFTGVDTATGLLFETDNTAPAEFTFLLTDIGFSGTAGGGGGGGSFVNGDFETGDFTGWTLFENPPGNGSIAIDSSGQGGRVGSVARLVANGSEVIGSNDVIIGQVGLGAGTITAGDTIDVSFDLFGSLTGAGGVVFVEVIFLDAAGAETGRNFVGPPAPYFPSGTWTTYPGTVIAGTTVSGTSVNVDGGVTLELKTACGAIVGGCGVDASFDNVTFTVGGGGGGGSAPSSTDFEGPGPYNFSDFGGGVATIIDNPQANGINTSARVGQMQKFAGEVFGGSTLDIGGNVDWSNGEIYSVKVWSQRAVPVLFKLEGLNQERTANHTGSGWEVLCFDFTGTTGGAPATAITFIFDLGIAGDAAGDPANWTFYFDDIEQTSSCGGGGGGGLNTDLTFEDDINAYDFGPTNGFGGGAAAVIANPQSNGINTSAQVGEMIKYAGEVFGGATLFLDGTLDIPASSQINMKVWSQRAVPVLFKLEGGPVSEVTVNHGGSGWEELIFDFSSVSGSITGITLIFDLGINGDAAVDPTNWTFYFDDIVVEPATGGPADPGTIPDVVLYATDPGVTVDLVFGVDYTSLDPFTSGSMFDNNNTSDADFSPAFGVTTGFGYGANIGQLAFLGFAAGFADAYATIDFKAKGLNADVIRVKFLDAGNYVDVTLTAGGVSTDLGNGWYQVSIPLTSFTGVDTATGLLFETDNTAPAEFTFLLTDIGFSGTAGGGGGGGSFVNGDFETGDFTGWTLFENPPGNGSIAIDSSGQGGRVGSVARLVANGSEVIGSNDVIIGQVGLGAGTITAGDTIDVSFDLFGSLTGAGGVVFVEVIFLDAAGAETGRNFVGPAAPYFPSGTWTNYSGTVIAGTTVSGTSVNVDGGVTLELKTACGAIVGGCGVDASFDNVTFTVGGGGGGGSAPSSTDFEGPGPYNFSDFGGGVATIIDNPQANGINTSARVGQMQKFAGEVFGGSTLDIGGNVDWSNGEIYSVKVWSQRAVPVLFKLEGLNQERTANHTGSGWEVLCFDFTGTTGGAPATAITFIFDLGIAGDAAGDPANWTFYFDDIEQTSSCGGGGGGGLNTDLTFEDDINAYDFGPTNGFGGGAAAVIANPQSNGINTSAQVGEMIKYAGEVFGGATLFLDGTLDIPASSQINMKVWSQRAVPVLFKLEGGPVSEVTVNHGGSGWEELIFDFSSVSGSITGITLIFDLGINGDAAVDPTNWTFYFDDIVVEPATGGPADPGTIPDVVLYATDPGVTVDLVFGVDYTSLDPFTSGSMFDNNNTSDADFSPAFGVTTGFGYGANIGQLAFLGFAAGFADAYATIDFKAKGLNADVIRVKFLDAGNYVDVTLTAGGVSTDLGNGWYQVSIPLTSFTGVDTATGLLFETDNTAPAEFTFLLTDIGFSGTAGGGGGGGGSFENGDFETGDFTGWTEFQDPPGTGSIAIDSSGQGGRVGSVARLLASGSDVTGTNDVIIGQVALGAGTIAPGDTISVSFDLFGSLTGAGGVVFVEVIFLDDMGQDNGRNFVGPAAPYFPSGTWTTYPGTVIAGTTVGGGSASVAGGVTLELKAACGAIVGGCGVDASFDNVTFTIN